MVSIFILGVGWGSVGNNTSPCGHGMLAFALVVGVLTLMMVMVVLAQTLVVGVLIFAFVMVAFTRCFASVRGRFFGV